MKFTLKATASLIILNLILAGCSMNPVQKKPSPVQSVKAEAIALQETGDKPSGIPADMVFVAKNQNMELFAYSSGTSVGEFCVMDTLTGSIWFSNPQDTDLDTIAKGGSKFEMYSQLVVYGYDTTTNTEKQVNSYIGSAKGANAKFSAIKNGFKTTYEFVNDKIEITLYVTLEDGKIKVRCPVDEIKENGTYRILRLSLVPYMGSGGFQDKGYMLVPDGSGSIIRFNNGKTNKNRFSMMIYGEDFALQGEKADSQKMTIRLPVFGINRNDKGLLGVISEGDSSARIEASIAGMKNLQNNVYTDFILRNLDMVVIGESALTQTKQIVQYDMDHLLAAAFAVDYYLLDKDKSDYSGMALKYKEILKSSGIGSKYENATTPFYAEVFGGMYKEETVMGFMINQYKILTRFEDALKMKEELNQNGVQRLVLLYNQWSSDEAKYKIQNKMRPDGHLGGKNTFDLLSKQVPGDFYPSFSPYIVKNNGNGFWNFMDSSKKLSREPILISPYKRSTHTKDLTVKPSYLPNIDTLEKVSGQYLESLRQSNCVAIYLPDLASMLYTNFDRNKFSGRQQLKESDESLMKGFDGKVTLKDPNVYGLAYASNVINAPSDSSNFDIEDETVPFYEMVLGGLVDFSLEAVNSSANPRHTVMKTIETGASLYYQWIYSDSSILNESSLNSLYGADYQKWKADAIAANAEITSVYNSIGTRLVTGHEILQENMVRTVYANGKSIVFNYNTVSKTTKYGTIEANSYILV